MGENARRFRERGKENEKYSGQPGIDEKRKYIYVRVS